MFCLFLFVLVVWSVLFRFVLFVWYCFVLFGSYGFIFCLVWSWVLLWYSYRISLAIHILTSLILNDVHYVCLHFFTVSLVLFIRLYGNPFLWRYIRVLGVDGAPTRVRSTNRKSSNKSYLNSAWVYSYVKLNFKTRLFYWPNWSDPSPFSLPKLNFCVYWGFFKNWYIIVLLFSDDFEMCFSFLFNFFREQC